MVYESACLKTLSSQTSNNGKWYYFSRLTNEQRIIYKIMFSGLENYSKEIKIPFLRPIDEIFTIFKFILLDNPIVFYVSSFIYLTSNLHTEECIIKPEYKYSKNFVEYNTNIIEKALQAFSRIKTKNPLAREIYVHDYCLSNLMYDHSLDEYSFSVLGPVINKTAVCEGIAKFVKLILDYLDVKCLVTSGSAKDQSRGCAEINHSWNIVKIGSNTYHLDVTFDLTLKDKENRYDYFNLSDEDIKKDHAIIGVAPVCTVKGGDYFTSNSLLANNSGELKKIIARGLEKGKTNLTVKIGSASFTPDILGKIMNIAYQQYMEIQKRSVMVKVAYNSSQMVFEINFKEW